MPLGVTCGQKSACLQAVQQGRSLMLLYNSYDNFDAVKWEHFPGFLSIMKASFVTAFVSTIVSLQCQGRPLNVFLYHLQKALLFKVKQNSLLILYQNKHN